MYLLSMECLPVCKLVFLTSLKKLVFDIKMEMHAGFLTVILSGSAPVPLCLYSCDPLTVVVVHQETDTLDCTTCPAPCCRLCCGSYELSAQAQAVSGQERGYCQVLLSPPLTDL